MCLLECLSSFEDTGSGMRVHFFVNHLQVKLWFAQIDLLAVLSPDIQCSSLVTSDVISTGQNCFSLAFSLSVCDSWMTLVLMTILWSHWSSH